MDLTGSIWPRGEDYDILGESEVLRDDGVPWLVGRLTRLRPEQPVVVDFGCWSGRHLRLLETVSASCARLPEQARESVIGIDEPFAKDRVAEARRTNPGFQVLDTGVANTGLGASSVDAGVSWRVLHNLTKPGELPAAIAELRRVLRDRAPLIVAVRAAFTWMEPDDQTRAAPIPLLYRTFSTTGDRTDYYFTRRACRDFRFYGFHIHGISSFRERELVSGHAVDNQYWMIRMHINKRRTVGELKAGTFIYHPGDQVTTANRRGAI